jgi:hypothetical protein
VYPIPATRWVPHLEYIRKLNPNPIHCRPSSIRRRPYLSFSRSCPRPRSPRSTRLACARATRDGETPRQNCCRSLRPTPAKSPPSRLSPWPCHAPLPAPHPTSRPSSLPCVSLRLGRRPSLGGPRLERHRSLLVSSCPPPLDLQVRGRA